MINISNFTSEDKSQWRQARLAASADPPQAAAASQPAVAEQAGPPRSDRAGIVRFGQALVTVVAVLVSWLAVIPRRLGDRLFAVNDNEAYWSDWQITRVHGGLGRRYRDPRFARLAECHKCQGAGGTGKVACLPCLGTGRITLGEVS